jgi:hypothetical protein
MKNKRRVERGERYLQSKMIAEPTQWSNIRMCVILFLTFDVGLESWAYAVKVYDYASFLCSKLFLWAIPYRGSFPP